MLISISYCIFCYRIIKTKFFNQAVIITIFRILLQSMYHQVLSLSIVHLGAPSPVYVFMRQDYIEKLESCH